MRQKNAGLRGKNADLLERNEELRGDVARPKVGEARGDRDVGLRSQDVENEVHEDRDAGLRSQDAVNAVRDVQDAGLREEDAVCQKIFLVREVQVD